MAEPLVGISSMATRQILAEIVALYTQDGRPGVAIESVGGVDAAKRVRAGEAFDLVALASDALAKLEAEGHVRHGSCAGFVRSPMAIAVRAGAAKPDISSAETVRTAISAARSVGFSTGPSGAHVARLLKDWSLDGTGGPKAVQATPGVPVGSLVARGEAEIGVQQLSELMNEPGIAVVGLLPPDIQSETVFAIGIGARSPKAADAAAFIAFLTAPDLDALKRRHGMTPA
jgi:molybdate transport system substrate-binding protein